MLRKGERILKTPRNIMGPSLQKGGTHGGEAAMVTRAARTALLRRGKKW